MTVRREIAQNAFLVKHISYLACDDTDTLILPCALRFTNDERRRTRNSVPAFAGEAFMDNAGETHVLNRGGAACTALLIVWTWRRGDDVGKAIGRGPIGR